MQRSLFLVITALNFVYFKFPNACVEECWRRPGPCHDEIYRRLIALIKACGPAKSFSVLSCGRKAFPVDARLEELHDALQRWGIDGSSFYSSQHEGKSVPQKNGREELRPYRPLDAERLKITGQGLWDCRPCLSDLLYMPLVEPLVNSYEVVPPAALVPDLWSVDRSEVLKLCKVCRLLLS